MNPRNFWARQFLSPKMETTGFYVKKKRKDLGSGEMSMTGQPPPNGEMIRVLQPITVHLKEQLHCWSWKWIMRGSGGDMYPSSPNCSWLLLWQLQLFTNRQQRVSYRDMVGKITNFPSLKRSNIGYTKQHFCIEPFIIEATWTTSSQIHTRMICLEAVGILMQPFMLQCSKMCRVDIWKLLYRIAKSGRFSGNSTKVKNHGSVSRSQIITEWKLHVTKLSKVLTKRNNKFPPLNWKRSNYSNDLVPLLPTKKHTETLAMNTLELWASTAWQTPRWFHSKLCLKPHLFDERFPESSKQLSKYHLLRLVKPEKPVWKRCQKKKTAKYQKGVTPHLGPKA